MAKSNSKTRRAQRREMKQGGAWFSSSKSASGNAGNARRNVEFREVLAKYANYYNARLTFKKRYGDFNEVEKEQLDDDNTALTYGEDTPMPTNVRLFRGLARGLQTGKEVAGTAALGARLAASGVGAAASGVASGISSGAKYGWSGMKSAASATRNAAKKTGSWFSRKASNASAAAKAAATAASRAVESPETTADRLLTELESNPSNVARNSKIAQVRAQLTKVRTGWGSRSKKADLERRLRGVLSAPATAAPANGNFSKELANVESGAPLPPAAENTAVNNSGNKLSENDPFKS